MKYVHRPFGEVGHITYGKTFNDFLGLGKVFPPMDFAKYKEEGMTRKEERYWMRDLAKNPSKCKHDGKTVYTVGDCWDYMYGDAKWPGVWYDVLPEVQEAYFKQGSPKPKVFAAEKVTGPKVAVHIRRGDSGIKMLDNDYFKGVIDELRKELTKDGKKPKFYIETDEHGPSLEELERQLVTDDVVLAGRTSDLHEVLHRMIAADAIVMSDSSLSLSAALIGNHSLAVIPACAPQGIRKLRSLPHWRAHKCKEGAIDAKAKKGKSVDKQGIPMLENQ